MAKSWITIEQLEEQVTDIKKRVAELKGNIQKVQANLDEHLLEHMIEERNSEFDLNYPEDED